MGISGDDLANQLTEAVKDYQAGWQPVDSELYGICQRRPSQSNFAVVFTKVAMIAAVYNAGLERAWRGEGDPIVQTTRCLVSQANLMDRALGKLADRRFGRSSVIEIVEIHGAITRALSVSAGGVWLVSAVSKYLHFHCPIVPIYDSQAGSRIKRFVDWTDNARLQAELPWPEVCAPDYHKFAGYFLVLYERIYAETSARPSVKEVDHLLWKKPT